ncbi:Rieske 2Fe-2S domain-containing protein [Sphingomonas histidinilytica]|uniref:aromatic ring-hydroxylating dioxygenase subunit alpha n=1 Tax=Rhizorhabdus histidinilytica TaxID=439228 RepID=UPI001AD9C491|nr:aromatic ring-hydroxylating dioxygenase subunit alpha [Rhizorhabdus histidinilytica]MBO9375827.1 Rieske 2Fe-2S domain-containing protein [Rhizorhabdus histidinilytica]
MVYLRNAWYVAAWSDEVSDNLLTRKILNEQVLLYRTEAGELVATASTCPHRFAPLHLGKVVGDAIECPYHGLRFNDEGRCVFNPDGDGRIPAGARLRTYPVTERLGAAWIWMGDPARADLAMIPDFEFLEDPSYRTVKGVLHVRANYRYINDNLMDEAHLHMVHHNSLACDMVRRAKTELVKDEGGTIWANRYGRDGAPPAIFDMMWRMTRGDYEGTMDHWVEGGWKAPCFVRNNTGVVLHGRPREEGLETKNAHLLTPETESTTHYFWAICRNFRTDDAELDEGIRTGTEYAFVHEDEVMLHAVQEAMGDREFWSMKPALLQADIGAVELRRTLDRMIAAEQAGQDAGQAGRPQPARSAESVG